MTLTYLHNLREGELDDALEYIVRPGDERGFRDVRGKGRDGGRLEVAQARQGNAITAGVVQEGLVSVLFVDYGVERWIIISMILLCDATVIKEDDRRRPGLPVVPLDMEYGYNIAKEYPLIHTT